MGFATQFAMGLLVACVIVTAAVDATAMSADTMLLVLEKKITDWTGFKDWCREDEDFGTGCYGEFNRNCPSIFRELLKLLATEAANVNRSCDMAKYIFTVEFCTNTLRALEQHCIHAKRSIVSTITDKSDTSEEPATTSSCGMSDFYWILPVMDWGDEVVEMSAVASPGSKRRKCPQQ